MNEKLNAYIVNSSKVHARYIKNRKVNFIVKRLKNVFQFLKEQKEKKMQMNQQVQYKCVKAVHFFNIEM